MIDVARMVSGFLGLGMPVLSAVIFAGLLLPIAVPLMLALRRTSRRELVCGSMVALPFAVPPSLIPGGPVPLLLVPVLLSAVAGAIWLLNRRSESHEQIPVAQRLLIAGIPYFVAALLYRFWPGPGSMFSMLPV